MWSTGKPAWHMSARELGLARHSRCPVRPDNTGVLDTACEARLPARASTAHAHVWAHCRLLKSCWRCQMADSCSDGAGCQLKGQGPPDAQCPGHSLLVCCLQGGAAGSPAVWPAPQCAPLHLRQCPSCGLAAAQGHVCAPAHGRGETDGGLGWAEPHSQKCCKWLLCWAGAAAVPLTPKASLVLSRTEMGSVRFMQVHNCSRQTQPAGLQAENAELFPHRPVKPWQTPAASSGCLATSIGAPATAARWCSCPSKCRLRRNPPA